MVDERKLIRLGNSSFAIALPKDWITKAGLKKGDKVFLVPNSSGEIIISPELKKINGKEIQLDLRNKSPKEISRELVAAYVKGNSIFKMSHNSKKDADYIKEILQDFAGIEIMKNEQNETVAEDLIDLSTISVSGILRRIDNTIRSILEEMEPLVKSKKISNKQVAEILKADKEINKFYFMLWKLMLSSLENPAILNTLKINATSLVHLWVVGMSLERIGDGLKRIVRFLAKDNFKKEDKEKIEEFFAAIKENYIQILNAYHKKDKKAGLELAEKRKEFFDKCEFLEESTNPNSLQIAGKMKDIQNELHQITKSVVYFID